jgi:hypothetical protein
VREKFAHKEKKMAKNTWLRGAALALIAALALAGCNKAQAQAGGSSGGSSTSSNVKEAPESDFTVNLTKDSTGVIITKYNGDAKAVRIPATIQGLPVREIGDRAFDKNKTITSVIIPEGVTSLWGFSWCENLTSVNFPSTLTDIGRAALYGTKLTAVDLSGTSITQIGEEAFGGCKELKTIILPPSIGDITLANAKAAEEGKSWAMPDHSHAGIVCGIQKRAFYNCIALTTVTIPEGVKMIEFGDSAFADCTALTAITIPETVEKMYFYSIYPPFVSCSNVPIALQAKLKEFGYTGRF